MTAGRAAISQAIFTEGNKGNEAPGVRSHQVSKHVLFLPLIAEKPATLRYLLFKTSRDRMGFNRLCVLGDLGVKTISRTAVRPAVAPYLAYPKLGVGRSMLDVGY